ncbi:MAG: type IV pilin N-terminal domain-containing protein [Bacteroidales bacterium]|nr:type IV pilin N-terminal domain-containing protein [Bacteroidales bacterium]
MKTTYRNDEAVSPVVGVILMVCVTIILAAVVAAFVFGMSGEQKGGHAIGVKPTYSSGDIVLTYYGGDGDNLLLGIDVTLNDIAQPTWVPATIGETKSFTGPYIKPTKALIVAHYSDGSEYIVINGEI